MSEPRLYTHEELWQRIHEETDKTYDIGRTDGKFIGCIQGVAGTWLFIAMVHAAKWIFE